MKLKRYTTPQTFYEAAKDFLLTHEALNNLIIGLTQVLFDDLHRYGEEPPYFAAVENDEGNIVAAAIRTPPFNFLLSQIEDDRAINILTENAYIEFGELPGVSGPNEPAEAFCERWETLTEHPYRLGRPQRIHELTEVIPVAGVKGQWRWIEQGDHDLLLQWLRAFNEEADENMTHERLLALARRIIDQKSMMMWEVDGEAVSVAGYTGPTPNGIRVNAVYTPPEHRRNGYASAVVAAISQHLLDSGRKFCFLYTDLRNPTSNHIYQEIGYKPVIDSSLYLFDSTGTDGE
jgi:predicted GNAT family acetyltransferase